MNIRDRIAVLAALGEKLSKQDDYLEAVMTRVYYNNPWFTVENQQKAVKAIGDHLLDQKKLEAWVGNYSIPEKSIRRKVGLVVEGNIPLFEFQDLICIFASGHRSLIKLSDKDEYLLPHILKVLQSIDPRTEAYFEFSNRFNRFDAVIATDKANSTGHFKAYLEKYPSIIRKNKRSVAVLNGTETETELSTLGEDVFSYFGKGRRNVSKIYVPRGYDFEKLLEVFHEFKSLVLHDNYKNHFDYNFAIASLNRDTFLNNGSVILLEKSAIQSRIAALHYEYYDDLDRVNAELITRKDEIQCVVSGAAELNTPSLLFGETQQPELGDYPDGVDTMEFLLGL